MMRAAFSFLSLALGVSLLGAFEKSTPSGPPPGAARHGGTAAGSIARVLSAVDIGPTRPAAEDHAELFRRLKDAARTTYINEIVVERDSALARWPDRHGVPLTVWIQPNPSVRGFSRVDVVSVQDAFEQWDDVGLPLQFAFINDSANADVHVTWIDHFDEPISGRTRWSRDDDYNITDANIVLALHHSQGDGLDPDAMRAMALHEIGHVIGLDHTTDTLAIMAPKVRVRQLSQEDRATARLLYALPAGAIH